MATVDDTVRVKIEVDEELRGLGRVQSKLHNLEKLGSAVGAGIGGAIAGGMALAAGAVGAGLLARGIMGIQSGDNPRVIEQKLNTFIPPKMRAGTQEAA